MSAPGVKTVRIGVITPSSNSVLEPAISRMAERSVPSVALHFTRIRVTAIDLGPEQLRQFDAAAMVESARLLGDLEPNVIIWAGTSGGWLGVEHDRRIADAIESGTKVRATTTTLANVDLLRQHGIKRVGFATPYVPEVCDAIRRTYTALGFDVEISGEGVSVNRDIAAIGQDRFARQVRDLAARGCAAISVYCTNVDFAEEAERVERELGVLMLDSVSVSYWGALRLAGRPVRIEGYGRIFRET